MQYHQSVRLVTASSEAGLAHAAIHRSLSTQSASFAGSGHVPILIASNKEAESITSEPRWRSLAHLYTPQDVQLSFRRREYQSVARLGCEHAKAGEVYRATKWHRKIGLRRQKQNNVTLLR